MKGGVGRAAVTGAAMAVAVAMIVAGGLLTWRWVQARNAPVNRMLVIATAPGAEGGEVAALALVVDVEGGTFEVYDTFADADVVGSSAKNARDAYLFGGGDAAAQALATQTGGAHSEWVTLPDTVWAELLDKAEGLTLTVPSGFSAYSNGKLTVVEPGRQNLTGEEAVALVSAAEYFEDPRQAAALLGQIADALGTAIVGEPSIVAASVASGESRSSIDADRVFGGPAR